MATPKSKILNQTEALMRLESRFLDIQSMSRQAQTCRTFYDAFKTLLEQAKKAAPLLNLVLNIDEKGKQEIQDIIKANPEFILYRSVGSTNYFSSKQNKIVARIAMSNISPLEAAALSGDFHVVNFLLIYLLLWNNISRDKLPDLKDISIRVLQGLNFELMVAMCDILGSELSNEHLESIAIAGLQLEGILSRSDFLSDFYALQKAYKLYLENFDEQEFWRTIDGHKLLCTLTGQIGEAQKKLSLFGLQVLYFNSFPHEPLCPYFTAGRLFACRFNNGEELDLDIIGSDLYRNLALHRLERYTHTLSSMERGSGVRSDSKALDLLCKIIPSELTRSKTLLLQYKANVPAKQESISNSSSVPALDCNEEQPKHTTNTLSNS